MRALNIEAYREALPLRRLYEAHVVEPLRAVQLERVDEAREAYRERKRELSESGLSVEDRLEAGRDALRTMRTKVTRAYRELRPQPFGEWLREWEEGREQARSCADRREGQEQTIRRERRSAGGEFSRAEGLGQSQGRWRER
jgi:LmbE family N-acetylglucosaminyl deacetylase